MKELSSARFHFVDHWKIVGTAEEAAGIFIRYDDAHKWWRSNFLKTEVVSEGDGDGVGRIVRIITKGFLPYCLRLMVGIVAVEHYSRYAIEFRGELKGRAIARIEQKGDEVEIEFESFLEPSKDIIRRAPRFIDPLFVSNHCHAMVNGEVSLQREIYKRRREAGNWNGDLAIQPGPVFPHNVGRLVNSISWGALEAGWEDQPSVSGIRKPV